MGIKGKIFLFFVQNCLAFYETTFCNGFRHNIAKAGNVSDRKRNRILLTSYQLDDANFKIQNA
jgi:hypothetical protein